MTTKLCPENPRPRRPRRLAPVKKSPGRPARPWQKPRIAVPHPVHPALLEARIPQEVACAWLGISRATAARWAATGLPATPAGRLLALYAHGLTLPPEAWATRDGRAWARFAWVSDARRPGVWWLLTPESRERLAWTAVDDAGAGRRRLARLADLLEQAQARAQHAEREAAHWRDVVANAT